MPKLWIGNKMYSVDDEEVCDYCEKLEKQIKELEAELTRLRNIINAKRR